MYRQNISISHKSPLKSKTMKKEENNQFIGLLAVLSCRNPHDMILSCLCMLLILSKKTHTLTNTHRERERTITRFRRCMEMTLKKCACLNKFLATAKRNDERN